MARRSARSPKQKPRGFHFEAFARDAGSDQRFDFLAFFFFLAAFFAVFLPDFFAAFFAEDFLAAFLAFLAFFAFFFGITFLAAFLTFLTAILAASLVASAALLIASVICSRTGFSSSISSPICCRDINDSGIHQSVKEKRERLALAQLRI